MSPRLESIILLNQLAGDFLRIPHLTVNSGDRITTFYRIRLIGSKCTYYNISFFLIATSPQELVDKYMENKHGELGRPWSTLELLTNGFSYHSTKLYTLYSVGKSDQIALASGMYWNPLVFVPVCCDWRGIARLSSSNVSENTWWCDVAAVFKI